MSKELIFVYNADSGMMFAMKDYFHKIISPKTYLCNLCALTYTSFGIKSEWKRLMERIGMKTTFLHKNDFKKKYNLSIEFPAIFLREDLLINEIVSSKEINKCTVLKELISLLDKKKLNKLWVNLILDIYSPHSISNYI